MKKYFGKLFLAVFFVLGNVSGFLIPDSLSYGDAPITGTFTFSKPGECYSRNTSVEYDSIIASLAEKINFEIKVGDGNLSGQCAIFYAAGEPAHFEVEVETDDSCNQCVSFTTQAVGAEGHIPQTSLYVTSSSAEKILLTLKAFPIVLKWNSQQGQYCLSCYNYPVDIKYRIYDLFHSFDEEFALSDGLEREVNFLSATDQGDMVRYKFTPKGGEKINVQAKITDYGSVSEDKWKKPEITLSKISYSTDGKISTVSNVGAGHGSVEFDGYGAGDYYITVYASTYDGYPEYSYDLECGPISGSVPVKISITSNAKPSGTPTPTPTPSKAKNRTSGCTPCAEMAGEPVQTGTGEYFTDSITDVALGGTLPLSFSRRYASRFSLEGAVESSLGTNWMHNFDIRLRNIKKNSLDVVFAGGKIISFTKNKKKRSEWKLKDAKEVMYQLRQDSSGYWLIDPSTNLVHYFQANTLMKIMDRNENTLALSYDSSGRLSQVSDGLDRTLTFTYDSSGHLTEVSDGARTFTYGYKNGTLASFTDALGNTTTYEYDSTGKYITTTTLPLGNSQHTQTYDSEGRVTKQADAYGNAYTFEYDAPKEGVTKITDPNGVSRESKHRDEEALTESTDAEGNTSTSSYDDNNRMTKTTDRLGNSSSFEYQKKSGLPSSVTDARGNTGKFTYSPQEQTISSATFTFYNTKQIDYPDGSSEEYAYDARGNMIKHTDRLGNVYEYTYNSRGQVLTETNPEGGVTTYKYNDDGTTASRKDSDLEETTFQYDEMKRLIKTTHPDGSTRSITYDYNDRVAEETDENGNKDSLVYDANGNTTSSTDALGNTIQYTYDLMDRQAQVTDRLEKIMTATYDTLDRMESMSDPGGKTVQYHYDKNGWIDQTTDGEGKVYQVGYDKEGRTISETSPMGNTVAYESDDVGNRTKLTDPMGNVFRFNYDSMSRVVSAADPVGRQAQYHYDRLGFLTGVTQEGVGSASYSRNSLNLLTSLVDFNGKTWSFDYTTMGRLSSEQDSLGNKTEFTYDKRGRLSRTTYPNRETEDLAYDSVGNLTGISYSDGNSMKQTYDATNRVTSADGIALSYDAEGNVTSTRDNGIAFGAAYDDSGRLKSVTYNNGTFTVSYTYDRRSLLTRVADDLTGATIDFTYDNDRRLTGITRSNGVTTTHTWDAASRLTRIQDGEIADQQFTYNSAGEITKTTQTLPLEASTLLTAGTHTFTFDDASQVSSEGYAYDDRGRQTAAPEYSLSWDGAGRLTGIKTDTDEITLVYNGLGGLKQRNDGNASAHYYYNNAIKMISFAAEADEKTGKFLRYYVYTGNGELLYMIDAADGNKVYFYHYDHIGSTVFLTDASGAVVDSYAYTPYGVLLKHNGSNQQPFTFAGRFGIRREVSVGLYQMRARYYDAVTARFLSRDPSWPRIGAWAGLNPYLYAMNDPVNYVDVNGENPLKYAELALKVLETIEKVEITEKLATDLSSGTAETKSWETTRWGKDAITGLGGKDQLTDTHKEIFSLVDKKFKDLEKSKKTSSTVSDVMGFIGFETAGTAQSYHETFIKPKMDALNNVIAAVVAAKKDPEAALKILGDPGGEDTASGKAYVKILGQYYLKKQKELQAILCIMEKQNFKSVDEYLAYLKAHGNTAATAYMPAYWDALRVLWKKKKEGK